MQDMAAQQLWASCQKCSGAIVPGNKKEACGEPGECQHVLDQWESPSSPELGIEGFSVFREMYWHLCIIRTHRDRAQERGLGHSEGHDLSTTCHLLGLYS